MKIAGINESSLISMSPEEYKLALIGYIQMPYLIIGVFFILLALLIGLSETPMLDTSTFNPLIEEGVPPRKYSIQTPHVWMGVLAIFLYVGSEVAIGQYIVAKVSEKESLSHLVKIYWGSAMIGRFIGYFLLKYMSPRKGIAVFSIVALLLLSGFLVFNEHWIGLYALAFVGLANSILFPCVFTLGIDGMGKKVEQSSAFLNMAIVGGAVLPFLFFSLPDYLAFVLPIISYGYIIFYGLKGSRYTKHTNFY
jgi:FHS family L-fucose permease-like MFS transporter